jgi:hypothetical protein
MNLGITILSIIAILFTIFWARYKLKDIDEGDLIDIGLGTYVERKSFEVRVTLALIIFFLALLVELLY